MITNITIKTKRCVGYIRVSTEDQTKKDFNSLDNQRERITEYVKRRQDQGWALTELYEDVLSAKDTKRPFLKKLLRDANEKKFDVLVVNKLDRFSRSVKDGVTIADMFTSIGIEIVSVTENLDTSTPQGRMQFNMLLVLAQWEREMTATRTKEKNNATRAKGMWTGGNFPLGYDSDGKKRLAINPKEADQVRKMFDLYLKEQSIDRALPAVNKIFKTKEWTTGNGNHRGGRGFTKVTYAYILKNPFYIGKISCGDEWVPGEHQAIVNPLVFARVQKMLASHTQTKKSPAQNKNNFLLRGLVKCTHCGSTMTTYFAYGRNGKQYIYYKCTRASKLGLSACPVRQVSARELEQMIIGRIGFLGTHTQLIEKAIQKAEDSITGDLPRMKQQQAQLVGEKRRIEDESNALMQAIVNAKSNNSIVITKLDEIAARRQSIEAELNRIHLGIEQIKSTTIDPVLFQKTLADFGRVFENLLPQEQQQLMRLLVKEIRYDGLTKTIEMDLRSLGNKTGNAELDARHCQSIVWLPVVEDVRTAIRESNEYIHIPELKQLA